MKTVPSISELRKICQKVKFQHFIEVCYRKISIYFTWILLHTSITANQATIIQMILGVSGSLMIMLSSVPAVIVGIFLWYFGYLFDFIDGEIARYRKRSTISGLFIDGYNHLINQALILFSVGVCAFRQSGGEIAYLFAAIPAAIFSTLPVTAAMKGAIFSVIERGKDVYKCADVSSFSPNSKKTARISPKGSFENFLIGKVQFYLRYPWSMIVFTILLLLYLCFGSFFLPVIFFVLLCYSLAYVFANFFFLFFWCRKNEAVRLFFELKNRFKDIDAS